jgi:CheY-like chemotaxis protein
MSMSTIHRILVVDDDWLIAEDLKFHLEQLGARVLGPACNNAQALELIARERPDFAYVDCQLGSRTCEATLDECDRRGIPVVIATAYNAAELPDYLAGRQVLGKPFEAGRVLCSFKALQGLGSAPLPNANADS